MLKTERVRYGTVRVGYTTIRIYLLVRTRRRVGIEYLLRPRNIIKVETVA